MTVDWTAEHRLPRYVQAAMAALHLERPDFEGLKRLAPADWDALLGWLDRHQMTLLFGHACGGRLPARVKEAIVRRLAANRVRLSRLRDEYEAVADAFRAAGLSHVVLKGFTHGPPYVPAPDLRPQYDLDLLVAPDRLEEARRLVEGLGFESAEERGAPRTDHCPPLVRRTGWRWKDDYFDLDIPPVVELHYRLWDSEMEGFDVPILAGAEGEPPSLPEPGRAAYAMAHVLRHLLRGGLKIIHLYELAHYNGKGRGIVVASPLSAAPALAATWFGGPVPADLPRPIAAWLHRYACSPLAREFRPNKDELWLHLELVDGWRSKAAIARRRLFPLSPPGKLEGQFETAPPRFRQRAARALRYGAFVAGRAAFHVRGGTAAISEGLRWLAYKKRRRREAGVFAQTSKERAT